ncbi:MAGUK p55 subfamily member 2 [Heterocephalus glaber]|uniref:MAGUK p55 subfamily member 2 n=1 Tax=Heterocephalus glaber TaxID=10181 RepID=G5BN81_HETGA|nr:MAGUK p55 subfamily member 2 [Heterocephalus glaber]
MGCWVGAGLRWGPWLCTSWPRPAPLPVPGSYFVPTKVCSPCARVLEGGEEMRQCGALADLAMPVAATNSESAMQQVLDNLGSLPNTAGAAELDLIFLRGIMESPIVRSLAKHHRFAQKPGGGARALQGWWRQGAGFRTGPSSSLVVLACGPSVRLKVEEKLKTVEEKVNWDGQCSFGKRNWPISATEFYSSSIRPHSSIRHGGGRAKLCYTARCRSAREVVLVRAPRPRLTARPPQAHERLEETKLEAVRANNLELVREILRDLAQLVEHSGPAAELAHSLQGPHFQGVTFRVEGGELVIARILHGGMVAQQGLLHVGDVIKEANGQPVGSDPRALQELLRSASGRVFVKCHFDYDPARDSLIPCKEAGLRFSAGDLLQIVNQDDANWWQACHVEGGSAGLIPSQLLEEKRKAFVKRDLELTPTSEFDRHELLIYEEVARVPPFRRKTLVLIGAQGVGRRCLKNKLLLWDPDRYGTTVPYTSRRPKDSEREGQGYSFVSRGEMEADIRAGRYLEHGEYEGNLYGTRVDSIRGVVASGKVCVLDVNPQAVKVLRTAEFVPYVVFIEAPDFETLRAMNRAALESGVSTKQLTEADLRRTVEESGRIQRGYGHYFDLSLVNSNLDRTFRELQAAMDKLRTEPQWVPVSWVY